MYFVILFLLCWLLFWFAADKSRARELYGVTVWSSFLGLMTDLIMVHHKLWSYSGLPDPLYTIPLLLDLSIYPVVTYLFAQCLPETWGRIFWQALLWTFWSLLFEWVTMKLGYMKHHGWWTLAHSGVADVIIYMSIAWIYRFYRPAYVSTTQDTTS